MNNQIKFKVAHNYKENKEKNYANFQKAVDRIIHCLYNDISIAEPPPSKEAKGNE